MQPAPPEREKTMGTLYAKNNKKKGKQGDRVAPSSRQNGDGPPPHADTAKGLGGKSGQKKIKGMVSNGTSFDAATFDSDMDSGSRAVLSQLNKLRKKQRFLFDPRTSKILPTWDMLTGVLLLYVAVITPVEVGFMMNEDFAFFFWVNRFLDVVFALDMMLQFCVIFKYGSRDESATRWASSFGETACHYFKGWFLIDMACLVPSVFDILPKVLAWLAEMNDSGGKAQEDDSLRVLSGLRIIRVLRILKMIKLLRVSRAATHLSTKISMPFATLTVAKLTVLVLTASHWFACAIGLQASVSSDDTYSMTWYSTYGFCKRSEHFNGYISNPAHGITCVGPAARYFAALEWSVGLVTGLETWPPQGPYSPICDELVITDPWANHECGALMNNGERALRLILLLMGALNWSYVVARFVEVIVSMNPDAKAYRNSIDELNRFIAIHQLEPALAKRLREYLMKAKHVQNVKSYGNVYLRLSSALRSEVAIQVNYSYFSQVHLLKHANERLCVQMAVALQGGVFAPSEYMPPKNLYMLHKGVAFVNGQVLGGGKVWGLNSMLYSSALKISSAVGLTYCEVMCMEGLWLRELAEACDPKTAKRIKYYAAFQALKHQLLKNLTQYRHSVATNQQLPASTWDLGVNLERLQSHKGADHKVAMPTEEYSMHDFSREVAKVGEGIDQVSADGVEREKNHANLTSEVSMLRGVVERMHALMQQGGGAGATQLSSPNGGGAHGTPGRLAPILTPGAPVPPPPGQWNK